MSHSRPASCMRVSQRLLLRRHCLWENTAGGLLISPNRPSQNRDVLTQENVYFTATLILLPGAQQHLAHWNPGSSQDQHTSCSGTPACRCNTDTRIHLSSRSYPKELLALSVLPPPEAEPQGGLLECVEGPLGTGKDI